MRSFPKFYNQIKENQILSLSEGAKDIWKNRDIADIDEEKSRHEIISEDKMEEIADDEEKYDFTEDLYPDTHTLAAWTNSNNNVILLLMDKKCYSQTASLKAIQKSFVRLMEFLFTHKVYIKENASPIYSFFAIEEIHIFDLNFIKNSMALSVNYTPFIYTSVLFTIGISLR